MAYVDPDTKIFHEGDTEIVSFHVSTACHKVDQSGGIIPSGATGTKALGGNTGKDFMISAYADEDLAENLAMFFIATILLASEILTPEELRRYAKRQIAQINPDFRLNKPIKPYLQGKEAFDYETKKYIGGDPAVYMKYAIRDYTDSLRNLFPEIAYERIGEVMSYIYEAAGAIDPIMLTTDWVDSFKGKSFEEAVNNICIYQVTYHASWFLDFEGLFGETYADNAYGSTLSCSLVDAGLYQLKNAKDEINDLGREDEVSPKTLPQFGSMLTAEGERVAGLVSKAVGRGEPLKIKHSLDKLETMIYEDFECEWEKDELLVTLDPDERADLEWLESVDIGETRPRSFLAGIDFIVNMEIDPSRIITYNAGECEVRMFTRKIPLRSRDPESRNFAVKLKTGSEVFREVQERYIARGYEFEENEFPLFWIPEA